MTTIELAPVEYTRSPEGILHLVSYPDDFVTLCGVVIRNVKGKQWTIGDETLSGVAATCLPCRAELSRRRVDAVRGNSWAQEGVDRCECGSKYWENDHCHSCGAEWTPEARGDVDE